MITWSQHPHRRLVFALAVALALVVSALPHPGAVAQQVTAQLEQAIHHPAGLDARVPADWEVREQDGSVVLLPPNPNPLGVQPTYILVALPRGDVTRPDDESVVERLEQQIGRTHAYVQRVGAAEPLRMATGQGIVLTWEGENPDGLAERAHAYVGIVDDKLVMLLARSSRIVMRDHEPVLAAIFATIRGPVARAPFAGRFESEKMVVVLEAVDGGYGGNIEFGGATFPVEAREQQDGRLSGTFRSGEAVFEFEATLAGETLTLASGGTTYRLRRKGGAAAPAAPSAGGPAAVPENMDPAAPAPTARGWAGALADMGPVQADPQREWTIAVYLDGDNDLEPFALRDLIEMEAGLPAKGVEIIVLIDRAEGYESGAGDWTDARVYRVRPDRDSSRIASEVICSPGELDMGDPAVLAQFVGSTFRTFPSRARMLILWDHGGGWAQMANDANAPGTPQGNDRLTLPELGAGLRAGLAAAKIEKLDLIGFDMCLMAQLETATELEGMADVMVASEAVEPGNGWPYNEILPQFGKGTLGSRRIAQEIVRAYSRFYDARDAEVATLSALDLRVLPEVLEAFNGVVSKIAPAVDTQWPGLSRSIYYAEAYAERTDVRSGAHALASVDLLDVLERMRYSVEGFDGEAQYRRLVDAMDRMVLASHSSPRRRLSNGLAIYAPVHGAMVDPEYMQTRLAQTTAWTDLLGRLHAAQQRNASEPRFSNLRLTDEKGREIEAAESLFNHRLSFTLEGDNIIWTQVWFGRDDAGANGMVVLYKGFVVDPFFYQRRKEAVADVVDLIMPEYVDGRNDLYQDVNGVTLKITDGKTAFDATIDGSALDDLRSLRVPVLLTHSSFGEIGATIVFDACWWQVKGVIGEVPQPDGRIAYRQVEPPADTEVTLLFETVQASGEMTYVRGGTFAWGSGPELLMDVVTPGTYRAAFVAETISGARAVETIPFEISQGAWLERFRGGDLAEFDPATMVGTWDHYLIGPTDRPTGLVFEISRHPEDENLLVATVTSKTRPEVQIHQVLWPDRRLFPSLRIFEYDDKGEQIGFYVGACGYGIRNGKPTFVYKLADVTRISAALVKRGPANTNGPDAGAEAGIRGRWEDGNGMALVCDGSDYALYADGQFLDRGSYVLRDGTLAATSSVDGETSVYRCARQGDTLVLEDEYGTRMVLELTK